MIKIRLNDFHFGNTVGQNMQTALVTTLEAADKLLSLIPNTKVRNRGNIYEMASESKFTSGVEVRGLNKTWKETDRVYD
jgi:hypothetical protein